MAKEYAASAGNDSSAAAGIRLAASNHFCAATAAGNGSSTATAGTK